MASVDGLISGLNTTDMISQLMQIEALPQTALRSKVTAQNKAVTAYQSINTKMAALLTAAKALTDVDGFGAMKATSSSTSVAATAAGGAAAGNMTFDVTGLARTQISTAAVAGDGTVTTSDSIDITIGTAAPVSIALTDKSAAGVASAINAAGINVKAAVVTTTDGPVLQLTSTKTGVANGFAVTGLTTTTAAAAQDAKITVGDPASGGYEVTSSSNTFAELMPGVTVTVSKLESDVTLDVAADAEGIAGKVQALVDAANAALTDVAGQSKSGTNGGAGGPLAAESTVRRLSQSILSAVGSGAGSLGSLSAVGVELDRHGKLTFDKETFLEAYADDPAKTQSYFGAYTNVEHTTATTGFNAGWDTAEGLARKLEAIAAEATEGLVNLDTGTRSEGILTGLINRKNEYIGDLNDQIEQWDVRLETRRATLERQWAGLEVALGKLQSQSSWLAGQLAGLPSYS